MLGIPADEAAFAQVLELPFELAQRTNAFGHMSYVLIEKVVDLKAILGRRVLEPQERANFFKRHIQAPAIPDEQQPIHVRVFVDAVVALASTRCDEQAFALVIADGFDLRVGAVCQLADFHGVHLDRLRDGFIAAPLDSTAASGFPILYSNHRHIGTSNETFNN